jgi:hypothetical protein
MRKSEMCASEAVAGAARRNCRQGTVTLAGGQRAGHGPAAWGRGRLPVDGTGRRGPSVAAARGREGEGEDSVNELAHHDGSAKIGMAIVDGGGLESVDTATVRDG